MIDQLLPWLQRAIHGDDDEVLVAIVLVVVLLLCSVLLEAGLWWWARLEWRTRASRQPELRYGALGYTAAAALLAVWPAFDAWPAAAFNLALLLLPLGTLCTAAVLSWRDGSPTERAAAVCGARLGLVWAVLWLVPLWLLARLFGLVLDASLVGLCACALADRARFDRAPGAPPLDLQDCVSVPPRQR